LQSGEYMLSVFKDSLCVSDDLYLCNDPIYLHCAGDSFWSVPVQIINGPTLQHTVTIGPVLPLAAIYGQLNAMVGLELNDTLDNFTSSFSPNTRVWDEVSKLNFKPERVYLRPKLLGGGKSTKKKKREERKEAKKLVKFAKAVSSKKKKSKSIKGSGDYVVPYKSASSGPARPSNALGMGLGSAIGSAFGPEGALLGGALGSLAHSAVRYFTGKGDYRTKNSSLNMHVGEHAGSDLLLRGLLPEFEGNKDANVIVYREYVGPVYSSQNFTTKGYALNPGLATTFPYLSTMARMYSQYRLDGCIFQFRSDLADSSTTFNQVGEVAMCTQYDPDAPAPTSFQQVLNSEYAWCDKGSKSFLHMVECDPKQSSSAVKMVRTGAVTQDLRFSDVGNVYISTAGFPADNVLIGQLWVTYKVSLFKPNMQYGSNGRTGHAYVYAASTVNIFFNGLQNKPGSTLPLTMGSTGYQLKMPKVAGNYMMVLVCNSTGTISSGFGAVSFGSDCSAINWFSGGSGGSSISSQLYALTGSACFTAFAFSYTANGQTTGADLTFASLPNSSGTTAIGMDIYLFPLEPLFTAINPIEVAALAREGALLKRLGIEEKTYKEVAGTWVVRYNADGTIEQWPYSGPIPPDSKEPPLERSLTTTTNSPAPESTVDEAAFDISQHEFNALRQEMEALQKFSKAKKMQRSTSAGSLVAASASAAASSSPANVKNRAN